MIAQESVLVQLVRLVDRLPVPPAPPSAPPRRGRPRLYSDDLFLKALVIMIVTRLNKVGELLAVLDEPTEEMRSLREVLGEDGRFPARRTFERRLRSLPDTLPQRIGLLGRHLVALIEPWARCGRAVAIDSTILRASGGVWHKKDREAGIVPHSSIDTEAGWTKSGWHGWVYGWKLHLACTVAGVWIPLAARLTPANAPDGRIAPLLISAHVLGVVVRVPQHETPRTCAEIGRAHVLGVSCWGTRTTTPRTCAEIESGAMRPSGALAGVSLAASGIH